MQTRKWPKSQKGGLSGWFFRIEGPTWLVCFGIYSVWAGLVWFHEQLPWWVLMPVGGYVTALHFSLQHEAIHSWLSIPKWLRTLMVWPPIGMWFPYEIYRQSHTTHHRNSYLTFPGQDTESLYHKQADWDGYSSFWRGLMMFHQTFFGRLAIGPLLRWRKLVLIEFGMIFRGDFSNVAIWLRHFIGVAALLYYAIGICGMPFWQIFLFFVYTGMVLGWIRPFIEHRYGEKAGERTALIESNWVFSLMFLNNNLHLVHHLYPTMPWFEIPAYYRANKDKLIAHNGGFWFSGYGEVVGNWLFKPVFKPVHPIK